MKKKRIDAFRHASRKLIRELGILELDRSLAGLTPIACHALIEIANTPGIAVSEVAEHLLLSVSSTSRLINSLVDNGLVEIQNAVDKRQKSLFLSSSGHIELKKIDSFSNAKVQGAFEFLSDSEQDEILLALEKYGEALETSRRLTTNFKILTLSTSRTLRRQIVAMIENIQKNEFQIPITEEVNASILRAEETFVYNNSCNFWYAVNENGNIIGSIGLKKIDSQNGELKKLFVDKRYRGKGLAQKLLDTLQKAAKKHGFTHLWLGTVDKLQSAQAFYKKCGFEQISESSLPPNFEKCHVDSLFFKATTTLLE